jgi:hypothetical protein
LVIHLFRARLGSKLVSGAGLSFLPVEFAGGGSAVSFPCVCYGGRGFKSPQLHHSVGYSRVSSPFGLETRLRGRVAFSAGRGRRWWVGGFFPVRLVGWGEGSNPLSSTRSGWLSTEVRARLGSKSSLMPDRKGAGATFTPPRRSSLPKRLSCCSQSAPYHGTVSPGRASETRALSDNAASGGTTRPLEALIGWSRREIGDTRTGRRRGILLLGG